MVIFGAIIITFIMWGDPALQDASLTSLTTVNGEEIPYSEYHRVLTRQLETYGQLMGSGKQLNDNLVQLVERQVASALIMRKVLAQKANSVGIVIGDDEILKFLQKNTAFQDPKLNRFSPTVYQAVLEANNLKPTTFENQIRDELASDRMRDLLEQSIAVSDAEIEESYRLHSQEMTLDSATFDPKELLTRKKIVITPAMIQENYKQHSAEYLSGEKRVATVGVFKTSIWNETLRPNAADVQKYFDENVKNSSEPEWSEVRAHAHHILIADATDKGLKRIKEIAAGIRSFDDFKKAAQKSSEDYSNASQGGDLGYFNDKTMVKPFTQSIFGNSKMNSVIGPVKTDFGYHLIWVVDRTGAAKTFENRRQQIATLLQQQKIQTHMALFKAEVQKILKESKDVPAALKTQGFTFLETKAFDSKTRLPEVPFLLLQNALRAPKDQWQGPEDFEKNLYVYNVTKILPAAPLSLEDATPLITRRLETQDAEKYVRALYATLQKSELAWEKLSTEGADLKSTKNVKTFKLTEVPGFGQADNLLKMVQSLSSSSPLSVPLFHEGKWIIFRGSKWSGVAEKIPEETRTKIKEELLSKKRSTILEAYMQNLVKSAKIPDSFRKKYNI